MKKTIMMLLIICLSFLSYSCEMGKCWHGTGQKTTQVYEIGYFREVNVRGMFEIILVQDSVCYIELEGGNEILGYVAVTNTDSVVYLDNSNECAFLRDYEKIKCYLHFSDYLQLSLFETCKLISQNSVTSNLTLIVPAEMADVNIQLNNPHFHFYNHRTTGGTYTFSGYSDWCVISGFYSARFILSDLISREMVVKNSSIGDMHVNPIEKLTVEIHNKGNIYYSGSPEIIVDSISGTGKLIPE